MTRVVLTGEQFYSVVDQDQVPPASVVLPLTSFATQMQDPIGTPVRDAIIQAYGDVGRKMVIVGSALTPLMIITVLFWRNINVKEMQQEEKEDRGNVF